MSSYKTPFYKFSRALNHESCIQLHRIAPLSNILNLLTLKINLTNQFRGMVY